MSGSWLLLGVFELIEILLLTFHANPNHIVQNSNPAIPKRLEEEVMSGTEFRFFLSCDINLPVTFRIERLEGNLLPTKSPNSGAFFFLFNYIITLPFPFTHKIP